MSKSSKVWVYGRHAVQAAIANKRRTIIRVLATQNAARELALPPKLLTIVPPKELERYLPADAVHQGIAIEAEMLPGLALEDIDLSAAKRLVLLDQLTDPHNAGAILRSAAAFGVDGVIVPRHNSLDQSPALVKAASGALEIVPFITVTNLASAMESLKKQGFWLIGLEGSARTPISNIPDYEKIALVLGSEGKGMRRLTEENCDLLVHIPIQPQMESLNVSNAAAIALYELAKK